MMKAILDEGADKGIFIQTLPIIVHMMVVGAFSFYKAGWPIRTRLTSIPNDLKQIDSQVSGKVAREIEKLILNQSKMKTWDFLRTGGLIWTI